MKDFRPIAVLPVLYKLYSRVLLLLQRGRINDLKAPQFAFRSHCQAHEVVFMMRNLVEKSLEWNEQLFVLDGGLHKAYDNTRHLNVAMALEKKGVPSILTAAWLREFRRCFSIFVLDREVRSHKVQRTRSLLQGDPAAPKIFNATLDVPVSTFCRMAEQKGWGFKLDCGTRIHLLLFADNFWLVAVSAEQLSAMTAAWLDLLEQAGWSVSLDETTWCSTGPDCIRHQVRAREVELPRASRSVGSSTVPRPNLNKRWHFELLCQEAQSLITVLQFVDPSAQTRCQFYTVFAPCSRIRDSSTCYNPA